jgi:uncharacterized damage-inducible protein DinB
MKSNSISRPSPDEYAPFYASYIERVPKNTELIPAMQAAHRDLHSTLAPLTDEQALYRYAEGKWTIKEIVQHLTDAERIFAYRMLRFARKDSTSLAGFDENLYAATSGANARPIERLLSEFALVRAGSLALLDSFFDDSVYLERGEASGAKVSVRALAYIIAGHELHHLAVLRERYLR